MADHAAMHLKELVSGLRVAPGTKVDLAANHDPGYNAGWKRKDAEHHEQELGLDRMADFQDRLAAQGADALLVVLQGIDAAGKDGTISHVMRGVNPQGVTVRSFKVPSAEELRHDYLWRYQSALPGVGQIGIFNRSHYEEVLVVRVHPELLADERLPVDSDPEDIWRRRFRDINSWERHLTENRVRVVKLFLNLSKEEQRTRFLKRIDLAAKNWKFSAADAHERRYWDDYQLAFSEMLTHTSTEWAPWYVIPADHKWFARIAVAGVIVQALCEIDPQYPTVSPQARQELLEARAELETEAPHGAPADPFKSHAQDTHG